MGIDNIVTGKNALKLIKGLPVACMRSYTLITTTTLVETTTKGTGKGSTYKPKKNNTTGSMEGVVSIGESGKFRLNDLRIKQIEHELIEGASIERTSEDGTQFYKDAFNYYLTSISDTGAVGDFNTFQIEFQVNGDPTTNITDDDFDLNFTVGSLGANSFHILAGFDSGVTWDISIDGGATYTTGLSSNDYTVSGLASGTAYKVVRRIHSLSGKTYTLPPITVTTL